MNKIKTIISGLALALFVLNSCGDALTPEGKFRKALKEKDFETAYNLYKENHRSDWERELLEEEAIFLIDKGDQTSADKIVALVQEMALPHNYCYWYRKFYELARTVNNEYVMERMEAELYPSIKLETSAITGPLGKYYEIVDKDYNFNTDVYGSHKTLNVTLKKTKSGLPGTFKGVIPLSELDVSKGRKYARVSLTIYFIDERGNIITEKSINSDYRDKDAFTRLLQLEEGQSTTIKFEYIDEKQVQFMKSFNMSSTYEEKL